LTVESQARAVSAGRRAAVSVLSGLVAGAALAWLVPWQAAVLMGWSVAAAVYVVWVLTSIAGKDSEATARIATREDASRTAADLMLLCAAIGSLGAVLLSLVKAAGEHGGAKALMTVAAVASVVASWAVVHLTFTLRYARLFFTDPQGGIDFHDDRKDASYVDFAYVAFTIGMTYQVSDTDLNNRQIRSAALRHALLSYLFGTVIIAITINVIAGLAK
jgi:uncharacterized membrane protein